MRVKRYGAKSDTWVNRVGDGPLKRRILIAVPRHRRRGASPPPRPVTRSPSRRRRPRRAASTPTRPRPSAPMTRATPTATGVYCESLPCPCAKGNAGGGSRSRARRSATARPRLSRGRAASSPIGFSATKYPHIRAHYLRALSRGWPRVLVLDRPGADARRERLLAGIPTRPGMDRDEYPPAVGRGRGAHLVRGSQPARLAGRRRLRPEPREPLARLDDGHQAAALLRRHPLPLRLLLGAGQPPSRPTRRGHCPWKLIGRFALPSARWHVRFTCD